MTARTEARINEFASARQIDVNMFTEKDWKRLEAIDSIIDKLHEDKAELNRKMLGTRVNISNVASSASCPCTRKTFYNKGGEVLKDYIEWRSEEDPDIALSEKCRMLEERIELFIIRDIDMLKKDELIDSLQSRIESLEKQNAALQKKLLKARTDVPGGIPFRDPSVLRIASWNVNGISSAMDNGLASWVRRESPDIICMQETRSNPEYMQKLVVDGYHVLWNCGECNGYSGTAILSRTEPVDMVEGIGDAEIDREARVITVDMGECYIVSVYFPTSGEDLKRLAFRGYFNENLHVFVDHLKQVKPVILCGDFNVAASVRDLAYPAKAEGTAGFTLKERLAFQELLDLGFIDTFRMMHPDDVGYTWWQDKGSARERNIGWRLDYILLPNAMESRLVDAGIYKVEMISDHAPVYIDLKKS